MTEITTIYDPNQLSGPVTDALMLKDSSNMLMNLLRVSSGAVSAYHGTKRNEGSWGWGLWWFVWGAALPIVIPAIAYAQGFGQPKEK